jgi:hypothetical protein
MHQHALLGGLEDVLLQEATTHNQVLLTYMKEMFNMEKRVIPSILLCSLTWLDGSKHILDSQHTH